MSDAAYVLGSTLATLGLNESTIRRILAERLALSREDRMKSLQTVSANDSSRNMLHSSSALQNQADTNLNYDRQDASAQANANDEYAKIAQQRLDAQAAYNKAIADEQARIAAEQAAIKPGFNPADPFDWQGIDAKIKAGIIPDPQAGFSNGIQIQPGGTPDDPYNWKGIAAEQAAQKAAQNKVFTPVKASSTKPQPKSPVNKPVIVAPPRAGKVVRF